MKPFDPKPKRGLSCIIGQDGLSDDIIPERPVRAAKPIAPSRLVIKYAYLYVLHCGRDDSLYCGITYDPKRRLADHRSGKGAKYTRGRGPHHFVAMWRYTTRGDAMRAEIAFKKLTRKKKDALLTLFRAGDTAWLNGTKVHWFTARAAA